jgi:hypothetical protein
LKDHCPRNDGKNQQDNEDRARHPAGLFKQGAEVRYEEPNKQMNSFSPQLKQKSSVFRNVAHADSGINETSSEIAA